MRSAQENNNELAKAVFAKRHAAAHAEVAHKGDEEAAMDSIANRRVLRSTALAAALMLAAMWPAAAVTGVNMTTTTTAPLLKRRRIRDFLRRLLAGHMAGEMAEGTGGSGAPGPRGSHVDQGYGSDGSYGGGFDFGGGD
jgi:uncharacterized membrane protein YgcG